MGLATDLGYRHHSPNAFQRVIQGVAEQMGGEIQRSLDFYAGTAADARPPLGRVVVGDPAEP